MVNEIEENLEVYNIVKGELVIKSLINIFSYKAEHFESFYLKLIQRFLNSLLKEKNIEKDLLQKFFKVLFKYFFDKQISLSLPDDLINTTLGLGNYGQNPYNRTLSVFFARKIILVVYNNKNNEEILNRIIRLKSDSNQNVRLEVAKSFDKLHHNYLLGKSITGDLFNSTILQIITDYIVKEEKLDILYYSFKIGMKIDSLQELTLNRINNLIDFYNQKEENSDLVNMLVKLLKKYDNYKKNIFSTIINKIKFSTKSLMDNIEIIVHNKTEDELLKELLNRDLETKIVIDKIELLIQFFNKENFNKLFYKHTQDYFSATNSTYTTIIKNKELQKNSAESFIQTMKKIKSILELLNSKNNTVLVSIFTDNFEFIEAFYNEFQSRENEAIVSVLMSCKLLYSEQFLEKIIKLNRNFYINCKIELQSSLIIRSNLELSTYLIKFCCTNQLDELLPYIELFFLKGNYFIKRHIFYFCELYIQKYSFFCFTKSPYFQLILLLFKECKELVIELFEFLKRIIPLIEHSNCKNQVDDILENFENTTKHESVRLALKNFKQFRFNLNTDDFINLYKTDEANGKLFESELDERNCRFLANKQQETSSMFTERKSKKLDGINSKTYSISNRMSVSKINTNNTLGGSYKKVSSKLKLKVDNIRPLSPYEVKLSSKGDKLANFPTKKLESNNNLIMKNNLSGSIFNAQIPNSLNSSAKQINQVNRKVSTQINNNTMSVNSSKSKLPLIISPKVPIKKK